MGLWENGGRIFRAFLGFGQQMQKIGRKPNILLYPNFNIIKKKKKGEGHFPSGHKYVTNYYHLERKRGSCNCGNSKCQVCNNIEEIGTFTSAVTGELLKINHLCCNGKWLVYLLNCKVCKQQYRGSS